MAEYTLTTPTAVAVGSAIPYNSTVVKGGCAVRHRDGSGQVTLKGGTCCCPARYTVDFHAAVTGVAGAVQVILYLDNESLPETLMSVVPAAAADVWSIGCKTQISVECSCVQVSARVITGDGVTVNTAAIIANREVA